MTTSRRAWLPGPARRAARRVRGAWRWVRVQAPVTRVLGPRYRRSRELVEIDITWACNLRCFNCNRSCEQAPTGEQMTLAQVERFLGELRTTGTRLRRIRLLGGEPTLHRQFPEILDAVRAHRDTFDPDLRIEVTTNGHGAKVQAAVARIPADVFVENTAKSTVEQSFDAFNVAPRDLAAYRRADFTNGCAVTEVCGVGLTPYGYYACAVQGGIDRILGLDLGRKEWPGPDDDLADQLDALCRWCGSFERRGLPPVHAPVRSESWEKAYAAHRAHRPDLTRFGDVDA